MRCEDVQSIIDAFVDGEASLVTSLKIEGHLQHCASCSLVCRNRYVLRSVIQGHARHALAGDSDSLYHKAPIHLVKQIRSALQRSDRAELNRPAWTVRWIAGTAVALAAIAIWSFTSVIYHRPAEDRLAQEVTSSHVRSFIGSHLTDVLSPEQDITTWFNGRLDFAPYVENLADKEFVLFGGRVDYLGARPVAVLVYKHREHFINLFTWPSGRDSVIADKRMTRQGYNLVYWAKSGMNCWAISDLEMGDLRGFAQAFQERCSSEPPN